MRAPWDDRQSHCSHFYELESESIIWCLFGVESTAVFLMEQFTYPVIVQAHHNQISTFDDAYQCDTLLKRGGVKTIHVHN